MSATTQLSGRFSSVATVSPFALVDGHALDVAERVLEARDQRCAVPAGARAAALPDHDEHEQHDECREQDSDGTLAHGRAFLRRADDSDAERENRQHDRHQRDVDDLEPSAEAVDVGVEVAAHCAQLLADPHLLVEEALQLGLLLGAHQQRVAVVARGLQLAQALLGLRELGLEALLGRAELEVGAAAQRLDGRERPRVGRAAAQTDQRGAARRDCRAR